MGDGDKGAPLRREGLYSSHIVEWRRARDAATVEGLSPRTRQPKTSPEAAALAKANRHIERLEADLAKHRMDLDTDPDHAMWMLELTSTLRPSGSGVPRRHGPSDSAGGARTGASGARGSTAGLGSK